MLYLRQSTASQSVLIGPFVDSTDNATAETALTIANTDIRLSANGGNLVAKTSGGATHDEAGWYTTTLDATDTATVGRLQLHCKMAGALMVHAEFQVLEEAAFDQLFAASAPGAATVAALATVDGIVDDLKSGVIYGAAVTGTLSTTVATSNLTGYADDQLIGRVIIWLSGASEGEATDITDYASTGGTLTFTALSTTPGNGDLFKIV